MTAVLGVLCATACGGGGGGGGRGVLSPLTLTIDAPSLDAAWRTDGQTDGEMHRYVDVTIAEALTEMVYVGIVLTALIDGAPATVEPVDMSPGAMSVSATAGDRVRLVFSEDVNVTPGAMRASADNVTLDDTSWEGTVPASRTCPSSPRVRSRST